VLSDGAVVGRTTSGSFSPTLDRGIALAYLDRTLGPGTTVEIDVRGRALPAEVVRPPFVAADPRD
jgi:aminomethyltransferase